VDDRDILQHIDELVNEERNLHERSGADGLSEEDGERLKHVEVALDQCWDLLRQRRALRHAGQDPDQADVRDEETVEHYRL
jgi:hypothetical protein